MIELLHIRQPQQRSALERELVHSGNDSRFAKHRFNRLRNYLGSDNFVAPLPLSFQLSEMVRHQIRSDPKQIGAKGLRYYKTVSAVHFVQDLAASVVVTTVTGCEKWGRKAGEALCVRYRALNSWHFDTSVHRDPDKAFAKLGTSSYHGSCEPWYLNGVTTVEHGREAPRRSERAEALSRKDDPAASSNGAHRRHEP